MKLIYQIGRLEQTMPNLNFLINRQSFSYPLSSFALREYLGNSAKVILIYPVSLAINEKLINANVDENFKIKIREVLAEPSKYLTSPAIFFSEHPHSKRADDFFIVHSIGDFAGIRFNSTFDTIVLEIFIDLVKRYMENKFSELYIDISSGHNIYVSALLEATRNFVIFQKLQNWDNANPMQTKTNIIFSDPILGYSKNDYEIHIDYELKLKAFFSSPISKADIDCFNLSRKIAFETKELKHNCQKIFEKFLLCFSSIKNNTPLVLYTFNFNDDTEMVKSTIEKIIENLRKKISSDWIKAPDLNKDDYIKTFLSLSFYLGILRILKELNIEKCEEISIDEISEKAKSLYKSFNLPPLYIELLEHEIRNLNEGRGLDGKTLKEKINSEWQILGKFLYGESQNIVPRNFLAHAGFERNSIEVKRQEEKIYVRYREDIIEKIRKILFNSL